MLLQNDHFRSLWHKTKLLMENKVVVTVLRTVSHKQVEHWESVGMRKESMGLTTAHMVLEEGLSQNS